MRTPRTALVDTTEYLAEPLGPAATAHLRVTRPNEPVLWAAYARAHYYDLVRDPSPLVSVFEVPRSRVARLSP